VAVPVLWRKCAVVATLCNGGCNWTMLVGMVEMWKLNLARRRAEAHSPNYLTVGVRDFSGAWLREYTFGYFSFH
jgi:hypothetical protein